MKPQHLSTKSGVPGSPAPVLKVRIPRVCHGNEGSKCETLAPVSAKPSHLSRKARVQAAPHCASGNSQMRKPRACRQDQGSRQPRTWPKSAKASRLSRKSRVQGAKPSRLSRKSRVQGAKPSRLSTKSRVQAAPHLAEKCETLAPVYKIKGRTSPPGPSK